VLQVIELSQYSRAVPGAARAWAAGAMGPGTARIEAGHGQTADVRHAAEAFTASASPRACNPR
jgi:hypothetical protein